MLNIRLKPFANCKNAWKTRLTNCVHIRLISLFHERANNRWLGSDDRHESFHGNVKNKLERRVTITRGKVVLLIVKIYSTPLRN